MHAPALSRPVPPRPAPTRHADDSPEEILSPCVPGRLRCHSVPTRNFIGGQDGGYGGRVIGRVKHKLSPDGTAWTWQQCAAMCLNYDGYRSSNGLNYEGADEKCVYFLLSAQKGCVLKVNQEKFTPNTGRNTVLANGVCTRTCPTGTSAPTTTTTSAPSQVQAMPPTCIALKVFPKGLGKKGRHAYEGRAMGPWNAGIREGALCAAECAKDIKCGYWMLHESKGALPGRAVAALLRRAMHACWRLPCILFFAPTASTACHCGRCGRCGHRVGRGCSFVSACARPGVLLRPCVILRASNAARSQTWRCGGGCGCGGDGALGCGVWWWFAGCLLKYWGLTRKKVNKDVYEMHGFCTPPLHAGCSELAPTVAGQLGDGYRGLGKRLGTDASTQIGKDGPVSRSPGACSTLCDSVPECQYWIVHNTKGRRAWLGFAVAGRAAIGGHGQRVCVGRLMGGPCRA